MYSPNADLEMVTRAFNVARLAHEGQLRESGEPYILHPLAVAGILADLEVDIVTIAAALLHDVVEDTGVTLQDIETQFGKEIAQLVDGVTKLGKLEFKSHEETQAENLRKMLLAMANDIRVILIKLADRLHNMRTLKHRPPEKQMAVARETLEIFAPLAHRLGISRVKWELEDLCLRYLEPEKYYFLTEKVAKKRAEREAYLKNVMDVLRSRLEGVGIKGRIYGRPKHFYSIYRKMFLQGRDFEDIYDLVAVRVIVDSVRDCYGALGVVHTLWRPIPGRFKDYISVPKVNMYQSLHTTVVGPQGEPVEVQIRTEEMHRTAEYGIAAHWKYKEDKTDRDLDKKLEWLRSIMEWQSEFGDAKELVETVRTDLFADQVFVFTPKGDVIDLATGSTPLDFAYQIHTDIGHRCVGAKVSGKIVPLDTPLKTGDIVEILTSKTPAPSLDWLNIAKTNGAKNKIRAWFKKARREDNLARGQDSLYREFRRQGLDAEEVLAKPWVPDLLRRMNLPNAEELLISIGYGGLTAAQVTTRFKSEMERREKPALPLGLPDMTTSEAKARLGYGKPSDGVRVRGEGNMLVRFSHCCNPVPGDPIIGYITRGRGVSIHRLDCPNLRVVFEQERERLAEAAWDEAAATAGGVTYPADLQITAIDRPGLLAEVAATVAEFRTNILRSRTRTKDHVATVDLVLEIRNLDHLQHISNRLSRVRDVMDVTRVVKDVTR
ncbi:MAG: bifunctional (p)ppGpp synthetase/guanosine-3',5'-bis(diphosphate) 3'-pyrophosphohydrolase [Firmicutes bacterium]|nr:bifunctional (p)ppGpp synthetase/guanosine-3',5'-bis(diphosphate) 3'-pyrophosphohydrolase [Bacillota bacterium]